MLWSVIRAVLCLHTHCYPSPPRNAFSPLSFLPPRSASNEKQSIRHIAYLYATRTNVMFFLTFLLFLLRFTGCLFYCWYSYHCGVTVHSSNYFFPEPHLRFWRVQQTLPWIHSDNTSRYTLLCSYVSSSLPATFCSFGSFFPSSPILLSCHCPSSTYQAIGDASSSTGKLRRRITPFP